MQLFTIGAANSAADGFAPQTGHANGRINGSHIAVPHGLPHWTLIFYSIRIHLFIKGGETMKVCIIGAGFIASAHAAGYQTVAQAELCGIADIRMEAARALAETYHCRAYADAREMLEKEKPDAVSICVPTYLHREAVCLALQSGANVLCEKPLSLTMADAYAMQDTARQCGKQIMVAQVLRFWPEYTLIQKTVADGTLGALRRLNARRIAQSTQSEWFGDPKRGGGALFDLLVHDLDFVVYLLGCRAKKLCATGQKNARGSWMHVNALITWENNMQVSLEASADMPPGYPFTAAFRADGESGCIEFLSQSTQNIASTQCASTHMLSVSQGEARMLDPGTFPQGANAEAFSRQLQAFCNGLEKGHLPVPFEQSLYVMKLIQNILACLNRDGNEAVVDF